jgi:hypothetical protein
MIRDLTILGSFVVMVACAPRSPVAAAGPEPTRVPIFRTIDIAPFGKITLSEPFAQRTTVGVPVRDRTYVLGGGRFADTDSILVTVDTLQRVETIDFVYGVGKDFAAAVADYEASLGAASSRNTRMSSSAQVERVTWSDGVTVFELLRFSRLDGTILVRSTLRNAQGSTSRPQN